MMLLDTFCLNSSVVNILIIRSYFFTKLTCIFISYKMYKTL